MPWIRPTSENVLTLVARGDYLIGFVPRGTDDEIVFDLVSKKLETV